MYPYITWNVKITNISTPMFASPVVKSTYSSRRRKIRYTTVSPKVTRANTRGEDPCLANHS